MRSHLAFCLLIVAACSTPIPPASSTSLYTADGTRIELDKECGNWVESTSTSFQYMSMTIVENGNARRKPKFDYGKPGFYPLAGRAVGLIRSFNNKAEDACSEFHRGPSTTSQTAMQSHNRWLVAAIETAMAFERAASPEAFQATMDAGQLRLRQMRESK